MARRRTVRRSRRAPSPRSRRVRWLLRACGFVLFLMLLTTWLPLAWLAFRPPISSAFMLQSRISDPATDRACERVAYRWVDYFEIAQPVRQAVVLAEDQRFFEHAGFDLVSIERAVKAHERGARLRGASTISQQLAKNLFLWPGRSYLRKGMEAWYTAWMELLWPKRRILELYLNVAQFGPCTFGVGAASVRFFDVPPAALSRDQAALLAAVLPSPGRMRANAPGPYTKQRAQQIVELIESKGNASWLQRI